MISALFSIAYTAQVAMTPVNFEGPAIATCINQETRIERMSYAHGRGRPLVSGLLSQSLVAHHSKDPSDDVILLHGLIGDHLYWMMLLGQDGDQIHAFETFNVALEGDSQRLFGRGEIPQAVIRAVTACGIVFKGTWPGAKDILIGPSDRAASEREEFPLPELLPVK